MTSGPERSAAGGPPLRILLVSQFWPAPANPELGIFVAQLAGELERRGHEVARAVIARRGGGPAQHARLVADAVGAARRFRPDVVFAHFLFPAGMAGVAASLAARVPLVVMAHGQDVRNVGAIPGVRAATAAVVRRAHTVIFNSAYLRDQLPLGARRSEIIDCGVDLDRFGHRDAADARAALGLPPLEAPVHLFAGALIERKNVLRLREALEGGTLLVVGDGPLRARLEGDPRVHLAGRQPYDRMPTWMAASDVVCLPSLEEPFGQALLEAMASERSVVATRQGGPPEFVTPQAGALVDPLDVDAIRAGLRHAASLPTPNAAARAAALPHALAAQAARMEDVLRRAALG